MTAGEETGTKRRGVRPEEGTTVAASPRRADPPTDQLPISKASLYSGSILKNTIRKFGRCGVHGQKKKTEDRKNCANLYLYFGRFSSLLSPLEDFFI
jgi:hypothetical protein